VEQPSSAAGGQITNRSATRWRTARFRATIWLVGLALVLWQVSRKGWLVDIDGAVTGWLIGHRTAALDQIALIVTDAFGPVEAACFAVLVGVVAGWRFRSYLSGLVVVIAVGGAGAACTVIKALLHRSRPPAGIQETLETDYSMPSGHVTGTVVVVGMLVAVAGLQRTAVVRGWLTFFAVLVVAAVALSRLYLGVHWLTDVVAALLLGCAVVEIGAATLRSVLDHKSARPIDQNTDPLQSENFP
jgi:membrane-associated phospholipid phosphatase